MQLEPDALCDALKQALDLEVCVSVVRAPLDAEMLSSEETTQLARLVHAPRRAVWLLGRAALRDLLAQLDLPEDTSGIAFPHPRLSLSHSEGCAIAIGTRDERVNGLGVDLELRDGPRPASMRFFLATSEREWVQASPERGDRLLRLWTIKEALYKSFARNRDTSFRDYVLADPAADAGHAELATAHRAQFSYASFALDGGFLSVARREDPR
jgi:4'-phosphopantetheinyl transferase EntD